MFEIELTINKKDKEQIKHIHIPQSWLEYIEQGHDARHALQLLLTQPELKAKLTLLKGILKLPKALFKALEDSDVAAMLSILDWLKPDASPIAIIPEFTHKGITYYAPSHKFENGTALEFALAEEYFKKCVENPDDKALLDLTAVIYLPSPIPDHSSPITQKRKLIDREGVKHYAQIFQEIDSIIPIAAFLYFAGVKKYIHDTYGAFIFEQPEETDETPTTNNQQPTTNAEPFGWWGIFMELAQNPINIDAIHQMNFHALCVWLVRSKINSDKMKQLFEKPTFKNQNEG
jgi:hypothetical protein